LANGLRVIVARNGQVPLATALLAVRGGSNLDPPRKAGLTQLSAAMWMARSSDRTAEQLAGAFQRLGLSGGSGVDVDSSRLLISGLSASLPAGLALMADAVRWPRIDAAQLRRVRADMADAVSPDELDADAVADRAVDLLVYGTLAGSVDAADPRTVSRITRADLLRQHRRLYRPDNAILVLTGDVEPQAAFALAEQVFGDWRNPPGQPPEPASGGLSPRGRAVVVDVPDAAQAQVVVAGPAIGRSDPTRYAAELANSALGGTYTSRLVQEIRVKRGLTYDVGSTLEQRSADGMFQARAETPIETAGQVADLMLQQLGALAATGLSETELGTRKAMLLGDLGRMTETSEDLAELLAHEAIYGRPVGELGEYPARLAAVSDREVQAAAARLADPSKLSVVIVADARRLPEELRRRFPDLKVVTPQALDRATRR
jgi:zinc protease